MAVILNKSYSFGEFELDPDRRVLLKNGEPVSLRSKTLDVLFVLIENNGSLVTKTELLDRVWKDQFVEENNLSVHIAALRKVFGEAKNENRYIVTVPGSGYQFVAPLDQTEQEVVIERHAIHRVVIDSEISTTVSDQPAPKLSRKWLWAGVPLILAVALGTWALLPGDAHPPASNLPSQAMKARIFPIPAGIPQRVTISPDGKTLAYSRRLKGKDSLWISDIESGSSVQITEDLYRLHDAIEFSPDGRTILFTVKDDSHPDWSLMSIPTLGGAAREITSGVRGSIIVSPDGRTISYFKKGRKADKIALFAADIDGRDERAVLDFDGERRFLTNNLSWSPNQNAVTVIVSGENGKGCSFAKVDLTGGAMELFGDELCRRVANFAWLKDGSGLIAAERAETGNELSTIALLDLSTGARRVLTDGSNQYRSRSLSNSVDGRLAVLEARNYPGISTMETDGTIRSILQSSAQGEGVYGLVLASDERLIYTMRIGDSYAIWEMRSDGSGQRELIAKEAGKTDSQIALSPDNKFIVFQSDRSGELEIWRANRDGSNLTMLTSGGKNSEPEISPDGRSVFYTSARDGKNNVWRIPIEGGTPEQLTDDDCSVPDVSPDGKYFVCATGMTVDIARHAIRIYPIDGGRAIKSFAAATSSALYNRIRWAPDGRSIVYKDVAEGLWQQNVDGGEPARMSGLEDVRVFHFRFLSTGTLLYSGGPQKRSIVLLERPTR